MAECISISADVKSVALIIEQAVTLILKAVQMHLMDMSPAIDGWKCCICRDKERRDKIYCK